MVQAIGLTYYDDERDIPSYKVKGKLTVRYIPILDYDQYDISGTIVDPTTVKELDNKVTNKINPIDIIDRLFNCEE